MKKESITPNSRNIEESILEFWQKTQIFEKLKAQNAGSKKYFAFLDGPITANGNMGIHHSWGRTLKDTMIKYEAMKGNDLHFQNGFDSQGLWVEVNVEKALGLNNKKDIEKFGLDKFTEACMERVRHFSGVQTKQSIRLGQFADWKDSYFTNTDLNITSIWHFLKECHSRGWIEEDYRPSAWCSRCGTTLSEHELSGEYKDAQCTAVFFKLPIVGEDSDILVWTTTPWTLAANVAVAVNPELVYAVCRVKSAARKIIVCREAVKVLKDDLIEIESEIKGSALVGKLYEPPLHELKCQKFTHKIVPWKLVDASEGAGSVHIAPGCGAEDFELGKELNLEIICPVNEAGVYYGEFGFLAGRKTSEVDADVFEKLREEGRLYYTHRYNHRYAFCWRCKSPIIFRLVKSWYIRMDELRPQLIRVIDDVEFQPDYFRERMRDWLTNMGDWNISRSRYYGLPMPFYKCQKCGKLTVVGGIEELKKLSSDSKKLEEVPHLHRPYIDTVEINCPHCGSKVKRVPETGDVWLDAGIVPFSTKKYFSDREFWEKNYPADCIIEGRDQLRGWFYALLVMGVALTGKAPYKKVVTYPLLLAQDGKKLSKSDPNNIPLDVVFEEIGADPLRYNFASNNALNDLIFSRKVMEEVQRRLLPFWNIYTFIGTYATFDRPDLSAFKFDPSTADVTDMWLIEKTNRFMNYADGEYSKQRFHNAAGAFEEFLDEISNWYVRVNRKRFWKSEDGLDKLNAYYAITYAMKNICKAVAPMIPFLSEYIWQHLIRELDHNAAESVFLRGFSENLIEVTGEELVEETQTVRGIIALASKLRAEKQIKVKQPLKTMFICADRDVKRAVSTFESIIKDELNIKEIVTREDESRFIDEFLSVNFKAAGVVLKGEVQKLKNTLLEASASQMSTFVSEYKAGKVDICGFKGLSFELFNLEKKPKPEFIIEHQNNITVVLDITIDENLMLEGLARELVRAVQILRKEAGYTVDQRILIRFESYGETFGKVIEKYRDKILKETLSTESPTILGKIFKKALEIGDESVIILTSVK